MQSSLFFPLGGLKGGLGSRLEQHLLMGLMLLHLRNVTIIGSSLFKRKQYSTWCDLTGFTTLPHEFPVRLQLRGSKAELCTQTEIEFFCVCKERLPERFPECG